MKVELLDSLETVEEVIDLARKITKTTIPIYKEKVFHYLAAVMLKHWVVQGSMEDVYDEIDDHSDDIREVKAFFFDAEYVPLAYFMFEKVATKKFSKKHFEAVKTLTKQQLKEYKWQKAYEDFVKELEMSFGGADAIIWEQEIKEIALRVFVENDTLDEIMNELLEKGDQPLGESKLKSAFLLYSKLENFVWENKKALEEDPDHEIVTFMELGFESENVALNIDRFIDFKYIRPFEEITIAKKEEQKPVQKPIPKPSSTKILMFKPKDL